MSKKVLFSAVHGRVLLQGNPVADAVVTREYQWDEKSARDSAMSGKDGSFLLPEVSQSSGFLDRLLPSEPMVKQTIQIEHAGKTYKAWSHFKRNYREDGELGRPIRMTCRLESDPQRRDDVFGICELE